MMQNCIVTVFGAFLILGTRADTVIDTVLDHPESHLSV